MSFSVIFLLTKHFSLLSEYSRSHETYTEVRSNCVISVFSDHYTRQNKQRVQLYLLLNNNTKTIMTNKATLEFSH